MTKTIVDEDEIITVQLNLVTCPTCFHCGKTAKVAMSDEQLQRWNSREGILIQKLFPEFPASLREMLMTGTHPDCWDAMFGDEYAEIEEETN